MFIYVEFSISLSTQRSVNTLVRFRQETLLLGLEKHHGVA